MRKLFVVSANPTTVEQDKEFQDWLEPRFLWWHWLNETWLLVDSSGIHTAAQIRNMAMKCFPNVNHIVVEFLPNGDMGWAAFGPKSATDPSGNMFTWIDENWHF